VRGFTELVCGVKSLATFQVQSPSVAAWRWMGCVGALCLGDVGPVCLGVATGPSRLLHVPLEVVNCFVNVGTQLLERLLELFERLTYCDAEV